MRVISTSKYSRFCNSYSLALLLLCFLIFFLSVFFHHTLRFVRIHFPTLSYHFPNRSRCALRSHEVFSFCFSSKLRVSKYLPYADSLTKHLREERGRRASVHYIYLFFSIYLLYLALTKDVVHWSTTPSFFFQMFR